MKRPSLAMLVLAALVACAPLASAQNAIYKFKQGKPYKYLLEYKRDVIQEMMGNTMNMSMEGTGSAVYTMTARRENGDMDITMKIESCLLLMESQEGTQTFGEALKDREFKYTIASNGKVLDRDTTVEFPEDPSSQIVAEMMGIMVPLDAEKLASEKTWERNKIDTLGEGDNTTMLTRKSIFENKGTKDLNGRSCTEIAVKTVKNSEGRMVRGDNDLAMTGEENGEGSLLYDQAEGLLITLNMTEKGEQTISQVGGGSMKVNIAISTTRKTEYIPD
ncbi:MAG: hypothetical protein HY962_08805 [Ignavibacteriae bacterium]|nr:hypothetical protein [Ignavibacteriota bacterium]